MSLSSVFAWGADQDSSEDGFTSYSQFNTPYKPSKVRLCKRLLDIPFGEDLDLVVRVKKISLDKIRTPYNASLIEHKDGYLLFFRYDVKQPIRLLNHHMPFRTYIGAVRLDEEFNQTGPIQTIDTESHFSEDPRVLRMGRDLFLSYNDMERNPVYSRSIRMARLDPESLSVKYILNLDQHIQPVEKNWTQFVYENEEGESLMYFNYSFNPHKIVALKDIRSNVLSHESYPNSLCLQKISWEKDWGILRGGTPARLVDGQYLAFVHSSFKEAGRVWYVMAAVTFDPHPPFRINAISRFPILFDGIYDTPAEHTAPKMIRCLFPSGFAMGWEDGREVIHVSCGENDCAVKIVTLDKDILMETLVPVHSPFVNGEYWHQTEE